jgi:GAF domain-containing protein/HAMP domain-containing protein
MAILGFANSQVTSNALVQDARRNLSAAGSETARQLDEFILDELERVRNEADTLGSFAYFNGDRSADAQYDVAQLLRRARARDPLNIVSYAVLDLAGNVLFTTTQDEVGTQEAGVDYLDVPLSTGRAYVSPVVFEQPDRAYFYFSNPVFDLQGSAITVLRIKYRASIWQELIARRTGVLGGESFAVLFDENFLHLAHGATQEAIFRLVVPLPDEEAANLRISGRLPDVPQETIADDLVDLNDRLATVDMTPIFEATDLATGARINQVAVARMGQQPWLVAYFQPQDVLLAPIDAQVRNTFVLTLVVAGIVTLATGAVAQILARPIVRLTEVATRVAEGDLDAVAPVETQDEIGVLAQTFNTMTRQLRMSLTGLETRIAQRTLALRLSSEVSRRLSNILEPDELVREVVEQVRAAFNFYHVHIYLLDQQTGRLNMAGGTGEPGRIMLERGHFMQPGQGLVGRAAEQNKPILVRDVESEPRWFRNDLLPLTRSELAVPIVAAGEVLGVLDVQSSEIGGLDQQDVIILESIANQVGTALSNARSFQEAQRATEREALINRITQSIQSTSDVDEALQVAVRELGEALGSPQAHVRLRSERLAEGKAANGRGAGRRDGPLRGDAKRRDVTPPGDDKT